MSVFDNLISLLNENNGCVGIHEVKELPSWLKNANKEYTVAQAMDEIPKEYYKFKNILYKAFSDEEVYGITNTVINSILSSLKKFEELFGGDYDISKINNIETIDKMISGESRKNMRVDLPRKNKPIMPIYSGQKGKKPEFDLDKLGKGNDEHGPGFYFSTNKSDTYQYASPSGIIITADMSKLYITDANSNINEDDMYKLIDMAGDYKETYYENGGTDDMLMGDTFHETINNIWYDIYTPEYSGEFVYNLYKLGYDGMIYNAYDDVNHIVIYNTEKLKDITIEDYIGE